MAVTLKAFVYTPLILDYVFELMTKTNETPS